MCFLAYIMCTMHTQAVRAHSVSNGSGVACSETFYMHMWSSELWATVDLV